MNNISVFDKCANCGACYNTCQVGAITVNEDGLFYNVVVNESKCIDCGACVRVCPVNMPQKKQQLCAAYGAEHREKSIVRLSSSGGAFTALANKILEDNGVVFGACYADGCQVVQIKNTDDIDFDSLRRSKYVESKVEDSFVKVKTYLKSGRKVLYCAAPCQIAGLSRYLGKEYENLYLCDFSCGGMPSHNLFQKHIQSLELKYQSKVSGVNFRPKTAGWDAYFLRVDFENGKRYEVPADLDPYLRGFIRKQFTVRDYCHSCEFVNNHYSDIVLADFWKYKTLSSFEENHTGLSMIITNSQKGEQLLHSVLDSFYFEQLNLKEASYNMVVRKRKEEFLELRKEFLDSCTNEGLVKAAKKYYMPAWHKRQIIRFRSKIKQLSRGVK